MTQKTHQRFPWPVGQTIIEWCNANGVTLTALAKAACISLKHLSGIVNGHTLFSADVAVRLGVAMEMPALELFRLQNDELIALALREFGQT